MWNEFVTKAIKEQFISVTVSGHVMMNRKDAEGDFLRQTGIKLAGTGDNLECITASGIRLGAFYAPGGEEHTKRDLAEILNKWKELPEKETKPGAVKVPEAPKLAENVQEIQVPPGAIILKTHHRLFTRADGGKIRKVAPGDYPAAANYEGKESWQTHFGERWEAQPDHMWIKEAEWQAIVRPGLKVADRYPLPGAIADRLTRAHLIAGMAYGECGLADRRDVRESDLQLTVTKLTDNAIEWRLDGHAALGTDYETSQKKDRQGAADGESVQGFEPKVLGYLSYDRTTKRITRFDIVALGDAYGTPGGSHHNNFRPGKYPIGITLELVTGKAPSDRVTPRAAVIYDTPNPGYWSTGKKGE